MAAEQEQKKRDSANLWHFYGSFVRRYASLGADAQANQALCGVTAGA
jgi:hypothetical protein